MAATVLDIEERQEREDLVTNERTRTMNGENFINENWASGASEDEDDEEIASCGCPLGILHDCGHQTGCVELEAR
jgi:hypothetical protein